MIKRSRFTAEHPGADQGMGIDIGRAEKFATVRFNTDLLAGLKLFQGRCLIVDFVTVNPQMTVLQPPFFMAIQT
jgi:hypothetical protein